MLVRARSLQQGLPPMLMVRKQTVGTGSSGDNAEHSLTQG